MFLTNGKITVKIYRVCENVNKKAGQAYVSGFGCYTDFRPHMKCLHCVMTEKNKKTGQEGFVTKYWHKMSWEGS